MSQTTSTSSVNTSAASTAPSNVKVLRLSDIIKGQAIFNVGTTGHVMHGKSTLVAKITGTRTQRHKDEQERNITINLGYANFKMFIDPLTGRIYAYPSTTKDARSPDGAPLDLLYHLSFVDCPGHKAYMSTMISGSNIMDFAIVVVASNEHIPQPQTHDHLMALEYSGVQDKIYLLNKLDLLKKSEAQAAHTKLAAYITANFGTPDPLIYPISAATGDNMSNLIHYLAGQVTSKIPKIISNSKGKLCMYIVRSYNVNRPNAGIEDLCGAVIGGSIQTGTISVGDQVEIRPGVLIMKDGKKVIQPLVCKVLSLQSDKNTLEVAIPGGLVGVNLSLFAGLSNADRLKGQVAGHVGHMPEIYDQISGSYRMISFLIAGIEGASLDLKDHPEFQVVVNGIMNVRCTVTELKPAKGKSGGGVSSKGKIALKLATPVVLDLNGTNKVAFMIKGILVASMNIKEGSCSLPIAYPADTDFAWKAPQYEIIDDLKHIDSVPETYDDLLSNISFRSAKIKTEKYTLPPVSIVNTCTYVASSDIDALIDSMQFQEGRSLPGQIDIRHMLLINVAKEIPNSEPRYNSDGNMIISGRIKTATFATFLSNLQNKIYQCPSCRGTRSTVCKNTEFYLRTCHNCPSVTYLHNLDISKLE